MSSDTIIIVSGLPRSGTSMMMQILASGGIEPLTDNIREPDADNPKGYFEFEKVKNLKNDHSWLSLAKGKAIKIISQLLKELPQDYFYKVIFMERNMEEVMASQKQMLINKGITGDKSDDTQLASLFRKHLLEIKRWLKVQPNIEVIFISYNETLKTPETQLQKLNGFFNNSLNLTAMLAVVKQSLYRQRIG